MGGVTAVVFRWARCRSTTGSQPNTRVAAGLALPPGGENQTRLGVASCLQAAKETLQPKSLARAGLVLFVFGC